MAEFCSTEEGIRQVALFTTGAAPSHLRAQLFTTGDAPPTFSA